MARPFAKKFYSSKSWQTCRNEYIKSQHYLCENCLKQGIYKPAEIVHHKIELTPINIEYPEVALNFDNLEALCRDCHIAEHEDRISAGKRLRKTIHRAKKLEGARFSIGENGKIFAKKN